MALIKRQEITSIEEDGEGGTSYTVGGNVNWYGLPYVNSMEFFKKIKSDKKTTRLY